MRRFSQKQIQRTLSKYTTVENEWYLSKAVSLKIVEVADTYELLNRMVEQESRMVQFDRFPYWAEVWPASLALARWLCERNLSIGFSWARELGCGLGVAGLALAALGWKVEATDYVEDALVFATHNAQRNGLSDRHRVAYLDWSNPVGKQCDCLIASDVVYEKKNHVYLNRVLRVLLKPGGRFYLSDPQRQTAERFVEMLLRQSYTHHFETVTQRLGSIDYRVNIHEFIKVV